MDGLAHDQRLRSYPNRKFGILRRLPPNVVQFLEQEDIFHVLKRTRFLFKNGYMAAKVTLEFDRSVVGGQNFVHLTWKTGEVNSTDAHEYVRQENQQDVPVV